MKAKKKIVSMVVEVSVPAWLTAAQARKEVRALIAEQCFHGHRAPDGRWGEIDESNFKVRGVRSVSAHVSRA